MSCALRFFIPVQKGCVTIIILGLASLSHKAWHHRNKKVYTGSFIPHHIHFCPSLYPVTMFLSSRNRQFVYCSSPNTNQNISHILHKTSCTDICGAGISPHITRQLKHKSLFLEHGESQREKLENCVILLNTTWFPICDVSANHSETAGLVLSRYGLHGCQNCQLQTFKKILKKQKKYWEAKQASYFCL